LATSANVAGAVGPLVATSIALRYHWSYGFMIPGCICMSIGYLCILLIRNRPSEVGLDDFESDEPTHLINSDDEEYSVEETDEEFESMSRFQKMQMIFSYPFFISICLSYFTVQLIKTLFSDWAQIYLIKSVKIDSYTGKFFAKYTVFITQITIQFFHILATHFLSLFEFCGIFGSVFSALLTDYILKRQTKAYNEKIASKSTSNGSKKQKSTKLDLQDKPDSTRIRMTTNIFYLIGLLIFMHLFNFYVDKHVDSRFLLLIGSMSGFFAYGSISLLGIMAMEFTSNSFSGTSHGIASLAANFGAIFAGVPFGLISKYYTWNVAFKCFEAFALTILVFLLLFRNSVSKFDDLKSVRVQEKKVQ
jgi:sugar phosphate permease